MKAIKRRPPPKLEKFPAAKQRRLDELLDKNSEGVISPREKVRLEQLVAEAEQLMLANSRRLARFAEDQATRRRAGAVPVTVWVQPEHAER